MKDFVNREALILPPLDENFQPAVLFNRAFEKKAEESGLPVIIGLERLDGEFSRFETKVIREEHQEFKLGCRYIERLVKFLLWQRGGHSLYIAGPEPVADSLMNIYSAEGERKFDYHFMGKQVYERDFRVVACLADEMPNGREVGRELGRHLQGNRIGFDLGASDQG